MLPVSFPPKPPCIRSSFRTGCWPAFPAITLVSREPPLVGSDASFYHPKCFVRDNVWWMTAERSGRGDYLSFSSSGYFFGHHAARFGFHPSAASGKPQDAKCNNVLRFHAHLNNRHAPREPWIEHKRGSSVMRRTSKPTTEWFQWLAGTLGCARRLDCARSGRQGSRRGVSLVELAAV
jgi:hypothetical protein